jgi:hypothetical protein
MRQGRNRGPSVPWLQCIQAVPAQATQPLVDAGWVCGKDGAAPPLLPLSAAKPPPSFCFIFLALQGRFTPFLWSSVGEPQWNQASCQTTYLYCLRAGVVHSEAGAFHLHSLRRMAASSHPGVARFWAPPAFVLAPSFFQGPRSRPAEQISPCSGPRDLERGAD